MTAAAQHSKEASRGSGAGSWLFTLAVLGSALLVFLVEPLMGRLLLPVLGGSAAVWNTSLAFFQAALLVGYGYAHLLQRLKSQRTQFIIHFVVLACAAAVLPLHVSRLLGDPWLGGPALWLVCVLGLTIGAPFAALSATAPLVQAWCARMQVSPPRGKDVYGLYAASNLGSLVALVAYPALVEPSLGLKMQSLSWSIGYGLFVLILLCAVASVWRRRPIALHEADEVDTTTISWRERLIWIGLAAAPSSLLLGVTGHISADVASAPFLWVVPLILYLATFIIAFAQGRASSRIVLWVQLISVAAALLMLAGPEQVPWSAQLLIHLLAFFTTALVCHQTLVSRRPSHRHLTEFYLLISVGGVIGGSFNALIAPVIFDQVWEYPVVLALASLARPYSGERLTRWHWLAFAIGVVWALPLFVENIHARLALKVAMLCMPVAMAVLMHGHPRLMAVLFLVLAIGAQIQYDGRFVANYRSFFGVVHVRELPDPELGPIRMLVHGTTMHGMQPQRADLHCRPSSYYAHPTVMGQVFTTEAEHKPSLSIGVIGLGAGSTAAYVRRTDRLRYYEIDPLVVKIAEHSKWFSFMRECARGPVDVVLGDARLKLHAEPASIYDLLLVDAFSSDSVPTHLLTTEAIADDLRHLKPDGVAVLHLSNRNMDLVPSAAASARAAGAVVLAGRYRTPQGRSQFAQSSSIVMIMAKSEQTLDRYRTKPGWTAAPTDARPWTDDYTNVLGAVMRRFKNPEW